MRFNLIIILIFFLLFWQGVFINPAFIEPFGLTLIEVFVLIFINDIWFRFELCQMNL